MKIGSFLKDKGIEIILSLVLLFLAVWLMIIFGLNYVAIVIIAGLIFLVETAKLLYDFFRNKRF